MSLSERFVDKVRNSAKPATHAASIGLLTISLGTAYESPPPTVPLISQAIHLNVDALNLAPSPLLICDSQPKSPIFVDKPNSIPQEEIDQLLNKESKELTINEFNSVFDRYFDEGMKIFRKGGCQKLNNNYTREGTALFDTPLGFRIYLGRGTERRFTPSNSSTNNILENRVIMIDDLNKSPKYPGRFQTPSIVYNITGNQANRSSSMGHATLTPVELFTIATNLRRDFEMSKNGATLPNTFKIFADKLVEDF